MKRLILVIFLLLFLTVQAQVLRGSVNEEYIPNGFFGSWAVISKLDSSNNPALFNFESRDIWTLSGYDKTLILQNLESGAHSEISINDKNKDKKTLKFERKKIAQENDIKIIYKEIVKFTLLGNNFSGTDKFIVEKYDKSNNLLEKNEATYIVQGIKLSGSTPLD